MVVAAVVAAAVGGEADKPDQNTETTMQGKERADKDNCREEINVEM